MSMLEYTHGQFDEDMLHDTFEDLGFESMLKESTWKKYINTFKGIIDE